VAPGTPAPEGVKRLRVILIKPSKYDDDGYVMRYLRGVLPSNTLAALAGLTEQVKERRLLGDLEIDVRMMDEHVQKIDPSRLVRRRRSSDRVVVALCGVQTNQFPRAADLALECRAAGLPVMIGGFHVSGSIAMSPDGMPSECQALIDAGVTLVKGEVDDCWGDLLRDVLHGKLKTFYDVVEPPDLTTAYLPVVDQKLMKRFAYPYMGTIDAGRGCPFNCSFCTIINVQGRKMRNRPAALIKDQIRRNREKRIDYYFFTDDNFSRNPNWEAIFDAIIELRRDEGLEIQFMMQIDVPAYRIDGFVDKAAEAGCSQVFIGMETMNPQNLPAIGKRQNRVEDYRDMVDAWHARGIATHVGYIIGFPFDTAESVRRDVLDLRDRVGVDQASFFMLVPIPGSRDHTDMLQRGEWLDEDYNRYDSFHPTMHHPRMDGEEWLATYKRAWSDFYSVEGMKSILGRANSSTYWGLFKNFMWYKYSALVENTHPMICGFFRRKGRKQRRPGMDPEPFWSYYRKRLRELRSWSRQVAALYFELQELWLATRGRARFQENIDQLKRRYAEMRGQLEGSAARASENISSRVAEVRDSAGEAWQRAGEATRRAAEDLSRRARVRRFATRMPIVGIRTQTRQHINAYWRQTYDRVKRGSLLRINPFKLSFYFLRDVKLCVWFNLAFLLAYSK
jgi:radical SAM superfamily enzyme YgiQ (UPF0313 family)